MKTIFSDVNSAYWSMCKLLLEQRDAPPVNGQDMASEILGVSFQIINGGPQIVTLPGRKLNHRLMVAEMLWNLVPVPYDFMRKFNTRADDFVADQLSSERQYAKWHYGQTLQYEIPRMVRELDKDKFTRRAVYTLPQRPSSVSEGTPPCLLGQQFLFREGRLHCITTMRSNDVFLGLPLDLFQFMCYQHLVAAAAGMPVGTYTHQAASLHLYARDVKKVKEVVTGVPWGKPEHVTIGCELYQNILTRILETELRDMIYYNTQQRRYQRGATLDFLLSVLRSESELC